ncbi:MAG: formate dehydrogenase accessory sulfurtransferase FdhD [Candidatus Latescibacterota bacterium]|jgi:FdhD protein
MDERENKSNPVTSVHANRISTTDEAAAPVGEDVCVVREAPVKIDVEGVETYTVLCTPTDKLAMAVGFLYSEGVVDGMEEVEVVKPCEDDPDLIRVRLTGDIPRIDDKGRNLLIVSSCGACGAEELQARIDALPAVGNSFKIERGLLRSVGDALRRRQSLFDACGGTHAAALFSESGQIVSIAEDTGRHNALDKAVGKCMMDGVPTAGLGAALSGRVSMEMVAKCARAGVELITAVSAPTSMAVSVAQRCNITLCAFVRESRATVFTHPGRLSI